jgi:hypothetical protein
LAIEEGKLNRKIMSVYSITAIGRRCTTVNMSFIKALTKHSRKGEEGRGKYLIYRLNEEMYY